VARSDLSMGARHGDRSNYAAAHNNLAIAYEHEGELDKARAAYEKALQLEPNNSYIKQNYELFKEINDRTTRKDGQ
jgi:Tfp pilus assembly protein PilF